MQVLPLIEELSSDRPLAGKDSGSRAIEGLWVDEDTVYSNFVASLDGVVAIAGRQPSFISLGAQSDRLTMGFLRAFADAVIIGAGTLRAEADHQWDASSIFPSLSADFSRIRRELGLAPTPRLVVVTSSGDLPDAPALEGALVVTPKNGASGLARKHEATEVVSSQSAERVEMKELLALLRARGYSRILVEGGPKIMSQIVHEQCLDEIFITISPLLIGNSGEKSTMLEAVDLTDHPPKLELVDLRNDGSHVFLRYRVAYTR